MSRMFEDVHLDWGGRRYTIAASKVMGAIKRIEDEITLGEVQAAARRGNLPMGKIAAAYAGVLGYAGCEVSAEEVYAGMFAAGNETDASVIVSAMVGLLGMMIPPQAVIDAADAAAKENPEGEADRQARRAAASLSKRPTSSR